jgi:hypothetical protein
LYMIKKNVILSGIIIAIILLFTATLNYPGGSLKNEFSVGFDWANNYISNLLSPQAVNGMENAARPWAVGGVLFLSASFGLFFMRFSNRIKVKSAANIIKYLGVFATLCAFLTVLPSLHDIMVTLSSISTLIIFFYLTVFALKSKLHFLKFCSVVFLFLFYAAAYMYFTRSYLEFMPIMQKVIFVAKIIWVLVLEYFTKEEDFEHIVK